MKAFLNCSWLWLSAVVVSSSGCSSPHGGSVFLDWLMPPKVEMVGNGSSAETPVHIRHSATVNLFDDEASWLYEHYATTYEVMNSTFDARVKVVSEHQGSHILDIATLAMPDSSTRTAYFDVTDYRK
jgi:hypothetical protein